jgi:acetyl-CoA carboxylase biotin carboxyl carrier protein
MVTVAGGIPPLGISTPPVTAAAASAGGAGTSTTVEATEEGVVYVQSPMVGTFYAAASPDAAPFIKVGDQVGPDTTVCIDEAMKVYNEIPAGCSGRITACLVEKGEAVEYGQRLFKVQKAA